MMRFKGTPLFGQDSNPRYTSDILALIGSAFFWLIFLICMIFIKPEEDKPKYKEVQIVLSSTPSKQKEAPAPAAAAPEASTASAEQPVQTPVETVAAPVETAPVETKPVEAKPIENKPVETKKTVSEVKPVESKPKTTESKPKPAEPKPVEKAVTPEPAEPVKYAVDPMEAFAQQTSQKTKKEPDWSQFDDEPAEEETTEPTVTRTVQNSEPVFSGSAASAAESSAQPVTSTSSSSKSSNQTASASTSSALSKISSQNFTGRAENGVSSEINVTAEKSGDGKVHMSMSNGSSRALLKPAKPEISLSEAAAATLEGSRTVKISFKVVEAGNVPRTDIKITPASILTDIVREEIIDQISQWLFESADYTATAEFEYRIVKQ